MGRDGDVISGKCPKCKGDILYDPYAMFSYCENSCGYKPTDSYENTHERRQSRNKHYDSVSEDMFGN